MYKVTVWLASPTLTSLRLILILYCISSQLVYAERYAIPCPFFKYLEVVFISKLSDTLEKLQRRLRMCNIIPAPYQRQAIASKRRILLADVDFFPLLRSAKITGLIDNSYSEKTWILHFQMNLK